MGKLRVWNGFHMLDNYALQVNYDTTLHKYNNTFSYSYLLNLLANPVWFIRILCGFVLGLCAILLVSVFLNCDSLSFLGKECSYGDFVTLYLGSAMCLTLVCYVAFGVFVTPYRRYDVTFSDTGIRVIVYRDINATRGRTVFVAYSRIRSVSTLRGLNLIRLHTFLGPYDVYAGDAEFDTVFQYLVTHCKHPFVLDIKPLGVIDLSSGH